MEIRFKFQYIINPMSFGSYPEKGQADDSGLALGKHRIDCDGITDIESFEDRLAITVSKPSQLHEDLIVHLSDNLSGAVILPLVVRGGKAEQIKRNLKQVMSAQEAKKKRRSLVEAGKAGDFRTESCPVCKATIDLSELAVSTYTYCDSCHSIFDHQQKVIADGRRYGICPRCERFDRISQYWEFYFTYLIVVYRFSFEPHYLCDACAHLMFKKTLLYNFPFLIGIPPSLFIEIKSNIGRDRHLKPLAKANALAVQGKYIEAATMYKQMQQSYIQHPGLFLNEGLALLEVKDEKAALACFEESLKACSNYDPAQQRIRRLQPS